MKKIFIGVTALFVVVMTVAFIKPEKKATTLYFHYIPSTMSDGQYKDDQNWELSDPSESDCDEDGSVTCLLPINDTEIENEPGATQEEQLASFLSKQSSASTYVAANRSAVKNP